MKNKIIIVALFVLASCKAIDKLTMFDLKYNTSFTIPKNTIVGIPIDLTSPEVATYSEEEFTINDTRKDLIEGIKLKKLLLEIENIDYTFSFLKSVEVYLKADGLPEVKVAEKMYIPEDIGRTLDMDVTDTDLAAYIKKDKIQMRVKTVTDKPLTQDLRTQLRSIFRVDAKILGI